MSVFDLEVLACMPTFSQTLEQTLHRTLALANERKHEYSTLEHLLLALTEDHDAVPALEACKADIPKLRTRADSGRIHL
jgi:ATP-dependent Clp protease ATP-binding subunit ClpA